MYFDKCGSLWAPVPVIPLALGIYVELRQEGLETTLILHGNKANF